MGMDNDDEYDWKAAMRGGNVKVRSRNESPSWRPVKLNPKFSHEVDQGGSYSDIKGDTIKKHFLYLGWKIDFRRDTVLRYRYKSPDGKKTYYSLKELFNVYFCGSNCRNENEKQLEIVCADENQLQIACDEPNKLDRNGGEDGELIEPEWLPDSVRKYIDFIESKMKQEKKGYVDDLRLKAKKHLLFVGWTWCMRITNRTRLFYESPAGKFFPSLVTACKSHLKDQITGSDPLISVQGKEKTRKKEKSPVSTLTEEFGKGKPINIMSLKRKHSESVSSVESPATPLARQETDHVRSKRLKRLSIPITDRTKEREKVAVSKASRSRDSSTNTSPLNRAKTILNLLIDKDIVVPRDRVSYQHDLNGNVLKEGWLSYSGIHCTCCHEKFRIPDFEIHAGCKTESPLDNIYLRDGRSLLDCLLCLMERDRPGAALNARTKRDYSGTHSDYLCGVCLEGGNVIFCDSCTSVYHFSCVGLECEPEDDWSCPSCSCMYCGSSQCETEQDQFCDQSVLYCDQCENEYHVGCNRNNKNKCRDNKCHPTSSSFCSTSCSNIWEKLDSVIGRKHLTSKEGYTWTLLKYARIQGGESAKIDRWKNAELNAKLCLVTDVLNECFVPMIESRMGSNLVMDMVFNKESDIRRLNYRGFYTIVLEKGDELVSTATLRVHGDKFAEMSLVGTRSQYRRQGLCKLLVSSVEILINYLRVKRLILPAAPQMLDMWTSKFGFNVMTQDELNDMIKYPIIKFPGSPLCHKIMSK